MAEAAIAATVASAAMQAGGGLLEAKGKAEGYRYQEAQSQRTAELAKVAADQTDSQLRDELNTTLENISAIRAAANTDYSSPTGLAIAEHEQEVSDRTRRIKVGNLLSQSEQSRRDADYYRYAAGMALPAGALGAIGTGLKTLSGR